MDPDVWHDSEHHYGNSRECVNMYSKCFFTTVLCSFFENDYKPVFFGKGKVKPVQITIKIEKIVNAFSKLVQGEMSYEVFSTIEEYLCSLYGFKCKNSINEVIKEMFEERSKSKSGKP